MTFEQFINEPRNNYFFNRHYYTETRMLANYQFLERCQETYESSQNPQAGDFVLRQGKYYRIAHLFLDAFQMAEGGSFHIGYDPNFGQHSFYISFSGSMEPCISLKNITLTDQRREGSIWIFADMTPAAHTALYGNLSFRVWQLNS